MNISGRLLPSRKVAFSICLLQREHNVYFYFVYFVPASRLIDELSSYGFCFKNLSDVLENTDERSTRKVKIEYIIGMYVLAVSVCKVVHPTLADCE